MGNDLIENPSVSAGPLATSPVPGVYDNQLMTSSPRDPVAPPTFVPGPVSAAAASELYGHYAETSPIKLSEPAGMAERSEPPMSPAPKPYDYSADRCDPGRPESRRRESDLMTTDGEQMSIAPPPRRPLPGPAHCGETVTCPPFERTLGDTLKRGFGKAWAGIERVFGGDDHDHRPPPNAAIGNRG